MRRRDFLLGAAGAGLVTRAKARAPLAILVLGGTDFLGPAVVQEAIGRGHKVTLFNRGKTAPTLFPALELIVGDRETGGGLAGLIGTRYWDAVIDIWPSAPELLEATATLLANRCSYYYYVSSISAYVEPTVDGINESALLRTGGRGYGGGKAESERILQRIMQTRAGICRPSSITGSRDDGLSYYYWLSRSHELGAHVAPGDGLDTFQVVDVRDVATWIVNSAEKSRSGAYNLASLPMTWKTYLETSRAATMGRAQWVWVSAEFLRSRNVSEFFDMPAWNTRAQRSGFTHISSAKARAAGWSQRPLSATATAAWSWYKQRFPAEPEYPFKQDGASWGLSNEREREILASWDLRTTAQS